MKNGKGMLNYLFELLCFCICRLTESQIPNQEINLCCDFWLFYRDTADGARGCFDCRCGSFSSFKESSTFYCASCIVWLAPVLVLTRSRLQHYVTAPSSLSQWDLVLWSTQRWRRPTTSGPTRPLTSWCRGIASTAATADRTLPLRGRHCV